MALDLTAVRDHIETGIVDSALTRLIDDATAEVESRFGTDDPITQEFSDETRRLMLRRPAQSITSVTEYAGELSEGALLTTDDYRTEHGGRTLVRVGGLPSSGYGWTWGRRTVVVYVPESEEALRDRVTLDLVRLAVEYEALQSRSIGDHSQAGLDYHNERERILRGVANRRGAIRIA